VEWEPRSPDLTSRDFYLWGHLKVKVHAMSNIFQSELLLHAVRSHHKQFTPFLWAGKNLFEIASVWRDTLHIFCNSCVKTPTIPTDPDL
jgi:hypothetical protein